jgi:Zn-dependent M28 family amino/carboxypeptidase
MLCLICLSTAHAQSPASTYPPEDLLARIRPEGIRAHMTYLSDDLLEGRYTGSRGYMLAAKYVAAQFQQMGLKPAGDNGTYLQTIRFRKVELDADHSTFTLKQNGQEKSLRFMEDFVTVGNSLAPESSVEAPVVFVGYGVTAPELGYDDYANAEVKGKIVAYLCGAPEKFPNALRAHHSSSTTKAANAAAHGAVGTIGIWAGSIAQRTPFSHYARHFRFPTMRWLNAEGFPNDAQPLLRGSAVIGSEVATRMFEGSAKSFAGALADAQAGKPQAFALPATVALHIVSRHTEVESPNIAAILPGSDEKLKNEYVLFTAHADHLGIGEAVNGDTIYNGAIDNASGTAAVIEIARALSSMPKAPRRSMLFVVVTGEEEGLLGSDAYAHNPTVPISQIVANVNSDEIGCFYDFRDIVPEGAEHSSLGQVVDDVAHHMGLTVSPDPEPEEVFFVRSDQYSFVKQGVPGLAIDEGYKAVDPNKDGQKITEEWEQKYYHSPQDDMQQPYLDLNAAAKATRLNLAIGYEVSQQTERPHWNKGDFFEKYVKH